MALIKIISRRLYILKCLILISLRLEKNKLKLIVSKISYLVIN